MSDFTSIITSRDRDCTGCRLISGTGLIGAGLYVMYHSTKLKPRLGNTLTGMIAGTIIGLGVTRLIGAPLFDEFSMNSPKTD